MDTTVDQHFDSSSFDHRPPFVVSANATRAMGTASWTFLG